MASVFTFSNARAGGWGGQDGGGQGASKQSSDGGGWQIGGKQSSDTGAWQAGAPESGAWQVGTPESGAWQSDGWRTADSLSLYSSHLGGSADGSWSDSGILPGTSVEYDASRNILQLRLKLGQDDTRDASPGAQSSSCCDAQKGGHDAQQSFGLVHADPGDKNAWHLAKAMEILQESLSTTEDRYRRSFKLTGRQPSGATARARNATHALRTADGIGALDFAPTEVLGVRLDRAAIARVEALGFKPQAVIKYENGTSLVKLSLPPNMNAESARGILSQQFPGIRFELNMIYRIYRAAVRDDLEGPKSGQETSGENCDPERCFSRNLIQWRNELGTCARGLKVGVIDTAIDFSHPTFKDISVQYADFAQSERPAAPGWHGTGVLSILAGNPASDTPGLIPTAEFYTASVFYAEEGGAMATDTISLLKALQWMKERDVRLINMSFAGPKDTLVKDAIEEMSAAGAVFVAAAGNEGPLAEPAYPAAYPQVIAVTAVNKDRRNYRYANRGQHIDFAQPGVDIWTAAPNGRAGFHSGTSFAAPHATAIMSLMLRSLSRETIAAGKKHILANFSYIDLGTPGPDEIYGRGLLVAPPFCTPPSNAIASAAP